MLELDDQGKVYSNEEEKILNESLSDFLESNNIVVLDFSAKWCGPCKSLVPILNFISNQDKSVNIIKIDIDKHEELADEYNITSLPQVLFFLNNELLHTEVGFKEGGKNVVYGISNLIVRNKIKNSKEKFELEKYNETVKKITQKILSKYQDSLNNVDSSSSSNYDIDIDMTT